MVITISSVDYKKIRKEIENAEKKIDQRIVDFYKQKIVEQRDAYRFYIDFMSDFAEFVSLINVYEMMVSKASMAYPIIDTITALLDGAFAGKMDPYDAIGILLEMRLTISFLKHLEPIHLGVSDQALSIINSRVTNIDKQTISVEELVEILGDEKMFLFLPRLIRWRKTPEIANRIRKYVGSRKITRRIESSLGLYVDCIKKANTLSKSLWNIGGLITYFWEPEYIIDAVECVGRELFLFYRRFVEISSDMIFGYVMSFLPIDLQNFFFQKYNSGEISKDIFLSNAVLFYRGPGGWLINNVRIPPESSDAGIRVMMYGRMVDEVDRINRRLSTINMPPLDTDYIDERTAKISEYAEAFILDASQMYVEAGGLMSIVNAVNVPVPVYFVGVARFEEFRNLIVSELEKEIEKIIIMKYI